MHGFRGAFLLPEVVSAAIEPVAQR